MKRLKLIESIFGPRHSSVTHKRPGFNEALKPINARKVYIYKSSAIRNLKSPKRSVPDSNFPKPFVKPSQGESLKQIKRIYNAQLFPQMKRSQIKYTLNKN